MKKNNLSNMHGMRRKDRQITDEKWIIDYISKVEFGTLATVQAGQPFLTMTVFVYDTETHAIYLHTSKQGRLFANIELSNKVCFSMGEMGRLLPADTAREFSNEYKSMVVFGTCEVMTNLEDARDKMHLLIKKYFPHLKRDDDYRAITKPEIQEIAVFKIKIDNWTAKQKEVEQDFAGAMTFSEILSLNNRRNR